MTERTHIDRVIDVAMLAGTLLIQSGSEIYRVEDTMIRIAHSQGIMDLNVLAMPAALFVSLEQTNLSRMKRILSSSYNIEKVCDVNQISRQLASGELNLEEAYQELQLLKEKPLPYKPLETLLAATVAAPFFTLMFGGNLADAIGAIIATFWGFLLYIFMEKNVKIPFVSAFSGAFCFTLIGFLWSRFSGFTTHMDWIMAGCVMPFVPGIALTNAIRDLMTNHLNTGMSKLFESLLIIFALGAGTTLAILIMNQLLS
ncbi:threonine/serine exporter family protein [Streptococcus oricebi]|uniref:Threonine/serine exporter-like N-terminal domain-containing protein n=1 Tax=Streptococcus oricebi TaxID=1547447 RepID=A0ABS5B4X0_9STRE|nr:threonine/serine exporter family protein [Streptococcus oricebi]MBP2623736.1 hypothetical protein [Streptococcus oricebi]